MSEHQSMEDFARAAGFASEQESHRMVVAVNLLGRGALVVFERWKRNDGTKAGLLAAFPETAAAQDSHQPDLIRESIAANVERRAEELERTSSPFRSVRADELRLAAASIRSGEL